MQAIVMFEGTVPEARLNSERPFHASIILNVHREAVFLRRTLLSLEEAVEFAGSKGLKLELVVVLDRTNDATRLALSSFDFSAYAAVQIIEVDNGSLGLSRNDGIEHAKGTYIFTADADDLVSYNYFYDIYMAARGGGPEALYFPQYVMSFAGTYFICRYYGLDQVTPMTFVDKQPYISRVCAHRDVFRRVPYRDVRLSRGYAYEDWHFNAEAVGTGFHIHTVKDTILFYRQRLGSLQRSADAISIRQIPPTRLFSPSTYLKISAPYYKRLSKELSPHAEAEPRAFFAEGDPARRQEIQHNKGDSCFNASRNNSSEVVYLDDSSVQAKMLRASAIEPAISISKYRGIPVVKNYEGHPPLGLAYYKLCDIIQDKKFSDVFLFPFLTYGGAEKYFLSLMEAMYRIEPFNDFLVLLGEDLDGGQWVDQLPPNVVVADMALHCRSLSNDERCLLALKIIETCLPETRIHLRQSVFADRFLALYGVVLQEWECVYYRFADIERIENGLATIAQSKLELISENLDHLSKIVCDNITTIENDQYRIGIQAHKWHYLPGPVEVPAMLPSRIKGAERRILWAARLDIEKRPSLLPLIATQLGACVPDARIEVFGGSVFKGFERTVLEGLPNLQYHGPYKGFDALPLNRFSIFIYTSLHDGIPNSILEAMSYGLPVIAPNVGGISEVVIDGETGILLPSLPNDDDMAASYVQAILKLMGDPDLSAKLSQGARQLVSRAHSSELHAKRIAEIFNIHQRHFQNA